MSLVWKYFVKKKDGKVECKECELQLSYTGGSTTSMTRHLLRRHDVDLSTCKTNNAATSSSVKRLGGTQTTLFECAEKKKKLDSKSSRHKEMTRLILNMIVSDMQPLSVVEDEGFRKYTAYLEPRYVIPSRASFRNQILPAKYSEVKQQLITLIKQHSSFSLTTDGWTSREATSYITYTLHLIDDQFRMMAYQLATTEVSESHTATMLCNHLISTCKQWGLFTELEPSATGNDETELLEDTEDEKDRFSVTDEETSLDIPEKCRNIFVTTDNAANITAAVRQSKLPHIRCFAHSINLAVQKGVKEFQTPLSRIRKIVSYFHKSAIGSKTLKVSSLLGKAT